MAETTAVAVVTKLNDSERELVSQLSKPGTKISVIIPPDCDLKGWTKSAGAICRAMSLVAGQGETLFTALGRLLVIAQENKAIWQGKVVKEGKDGEPDEGEYKSFEEFLEAEIVTKYGVGRSTCFEAKRVIERWPDLPMGQYRAIGRVKFKDLVKVIPKGDEDKSNSKKLLEKAATLTRDQLVAYIEESTNGLITKPDLTGDKISFTTTKTRGTYIRRFFDNPAIIAYVGSDDIGVILECLIDECKETWKDEGQKKLEEAEKEAAKESEKSEASAAD